MIAIILKTKPNVWITLLIFLPHDTKAAKLENV